MAENVTPQKITLRPEQVKAIPVLLVGSASQAAKAAGVHTRTIRRWLKEPEFAAVLAEAEAAVLAEAARIAAGASSMAVRELLKILRSKTAEPKHKIAAARALLGALPSVRMIGAIEGKLADLEASLDGTPKWSDEAD